MSEQTYAIKIFLSPMAGWDYFRNELKDIRVYQSCKEANLVACELGNALVVEYSPPADSNAPKFTEVNEQNRTYVFPNFQRVTLNGVVSINVSKSGTHRINTKDGKKHIIPSGWLHIEFEADSWTF